LNSCSGGHFFLFLLTLIPTFQIENHSVKGFSTLSTSAEANAEKPIFASDELVSCPVTVCNFFLAGISYFYLLFLKKKTEL
jgi:hypothetical protein